MLTADQELNGADFDDVFQQFSFPKAQEPNETREKLYLKTLETISLSLDKSDP